MPTWISISPADLPTAKAAALVDALATAALGEGQADPIPEVIANVTVRIRAEISAGGKTVLDRDATKLPPSLKALAVRMVLRDAQSRLNALGALPLSDDERKEWDQDVRYLERIGRGEVGVEASDNPESVPTIQGNTARPITLPRHHHFSREDQDGI